MAQEVIFTDGFENPPPQFTSSPVLSGIVGEAYDYDVDAVDFEGDPLRYRLSTSPDGMDINVLSGVISWIPELRITSMLSTVPFCRIPTVRIRSPCSFFCRSSCG